MAITDRRLIAAMMLVETLKSSTHFAEKIEDDGMVAKLIALRHDAEKQVRLIAQHVAER